MSPDRHTKPACVLVAEDEMLVSMMLEDLLLESGYHVLMAARLAKGLELVATESIDVAVLDINLAGQNSFPLADALRLRDIPFLFASGYGREGLPENYRDSTMLQKPYDATSLRNALSKLLTATRSNQSRGK